PLQSFQMIYKNGDRSPPLQRVEVPRSVGDVGVLWDASLLDIAGTTIIVEATDELGRTYQDFIPFRPPPSFSPLSLDASLSEPAVARVQISFDSNGATIAPGSRLTFFPLPTTAASTDAERKSAIEENLKTPLNQIADKAEVSLVIDHEITSLPEKPIFVDLT